MSPCQATRTRQHTSVAPDGGAARSSRWPRLTTAAAQIIRYVNAIQDGKFQTPSGREIRVAPNTPFYGHVVCDTPAKVKEWLQREKNFTPMPDGLGWFNWCPQTHLYIEVWSLDKVVTDAKIRNAIFFKHLGL